MSGFEIAGLVLGAFSVAHHLTGAGKGSAGIFERTAKVQKENEHIRKRLFLQKKSFLFHLKRLLSDCIDDSKVNALLENPSSQIWSDPQLIANLEKRLGEAYQEARTALELVHKALEDIEGTLRKVSKTGNDELLGENLLNLSSSNPSEDILSKDHLSLRTKRNAALKDPKIREQFKALKDSNSEFQQVVDRVLLQVSPGISKHSSLEKSTAVGARADLTSIRRMQKISQRLYEVMRNSRGFPCPCHGFNLALEFDTQSAAREAHQQRCFRLLAVMKSSAATSFEEMMLDINDLSTSSQEITGPQLVEIRARKFVVPKQPRSILKKPQSKGPLTSTTRSGDGPGNPTPEGEAKVCGKRSRIAVSFQLPLSFRKLSAGKQRQRPEDDDTDEEIEAEKPVIQLNEIDDLCSCLSKVNHYKPSVVQRDEEECIGYLPDASEGTQYLFYSLEWPLPGPATSNKSLFDVLRSKTGSEAFKVPARLELAFILSISLLQHQSSPWIKKKFHSWDFGLYPALSGSSSALSWLPHIAVTFDSINQTLARQHSQGAKETRVPSLGKILIEIGRAKPLSLDPVVIDEEQEQIEILKHVRQKSTVVDMGSVYQKVVNTCVMWDEDDHLSTEAVQVKFYDEVVCKLDRALWAINDMSRLGVDWGCK